eukprot:6487594-Amphidinium_carterae.1
MKEDTIDHYGRTIHKGQFNMLFSYISGDGYNYEQIHFWFEGEKMVTSVSYKQETDEVNGPQVRRIKDHNREITEDDSISQAGQEEP